MCVAALTSPPECFVLHGARYSPTNSSTDGAGADPRALYQALNQLRPDTRHVYAVKELNLRRDVINLRFTEGKLAFLQALDGRVTGAVFTGRGHIFATPHDRDERQSLARFVGVPLLDQIFARAYFRFTDDTAAELGQQLKTSESIAVNDPDFATSWEPIVSNLNTWHSIRIMFDLLSASPQPYFYAGIGSENVGPFDALVDNRRDEQVLFGQPRFVNGARFYDTWATFRSQDSPAARIEEFAPVDYRVETTVADDLSLEGKTTLHIRTLRAGERIVPLELSRNLAVEEVKLSDGRPLVYFQNEDLSRRDILRQGNDSLLVVLPAGAKSGEEFQMEIKYRGSVISQAGNGVEFVGEHGTWYAHVGGGDHFVPFDLTFRWPKRFTLVATGTKVESHDEGDTRAGRWRSDVPFAVAGFNLGEYKMETAGGDNPKVYLYANQQLEDAILELLRKGNAPSAAEVLPPNFRSAHPHTSPVVMPDLPPSPAAILKRLGGQVADSVHFFETMNGPFPFDHLDVSQIPGSFGQGWPGLLYLSTLVFMTPEAQAKAGLAERTREEARELMPFHEVAHQWWGNVVGSAIYRDAWIEEGMANYLALLYTDAKKPGEHRLASWLEHYRAALSAPIPESTQIVGDAGPLTFGVRLTSSRAPNAYETITYGKGTWVMHMLHDMLRDPGASDPDGLFRELLRAILTDYRFRALSTADFQREVEKRMTRAMDLESTHSMNWFFAQWVRGTGIPHYAVEYQVKPHGQEYLVTGKLLQTGVEDIFTAAVPLYGGKPGGKLERLGIVVTTGPETRFHFVVKNRPPRILVDPQLTLLCRMD
ncbi:MAG TPA: M1 family aminopeptidase [Candidatus Limnocylindria bacterium]|nr:M1 family aminopeptidase [Candidatus Limnocylindria bacterium]